MEGESESQRIRREKQMYLRTNVLEAGYSPQEFQEFVLEYKEDGTNIDNWTKEELESFVKEFHQVMKLRRPSKNAEMRRSMKKENPQFKPQEETKEKQDNKHKVEERLVGRSIKSSLNFLDNLDFKISDYDTKATGLFGLGKVSILFTVRTLPLDYQVKRKFSQFIWLRDTLSKLFPGYFIPPLFKKKKSKNANELFIVKRMKYLQNFLKSLAKSQDLLTCKYLEEFLKNDNEKAFAAIMKEGDNLSKVETISGVTNLDGKVQIAFNKEQKKFFHYFNEFCKQADPIYREIRTHSKELILDIDKVFETLNSIGKSCAQLNTISTQFNEYNEEYKCPEMQENYLKLNNMMMNWGDIFAQQLGVIEDHFSSFFKFYNQELESYKSVRFIE